MVTWRSGKRGRALAVAALLAGVSLAAGCGGANRLPAGATAPGRPATSPAPTAPAATDLASSILATARSQIGAPYRSGGCDPRGGFDCSGFVHWVYAANGVDLPRISHDQASVGRSVAPRDLRPADLLFFRTSWRDSTTHVGIYVGQGRFIHSPTSGGAVREESLDLPYWSSRLTDVRRVLWRSGEWSEEWPPLCLAE